jgi:hypothetical protein
MALKPITLRLDEDEYEKLKGHLEAFGDPDINVAYVLRSYIRDLNRAMPFLVRAGWDLKNYFGLLGSWLKQFGSMTDMDMFAKMTVNPWSLWGVAAGGKRGETSEDAEKGTGADEKDNGKNK